MRSSITPLATLSAALLALSLGCGDDGAGGADTTPGDTAADTVGDTAADTYTPPTAPILERTPQIVASCSLTAPLTPIPDAQWYTRALARTTTTTWLAYEGYDRSGSFTRVASLARDGTLGAPLALDDLDGRVFLAAAGERLAISYGRQVSDAPAHRFAVADAGGSFVVAPRDADAVGALAALDEGFAMVSPTVDPGGNGHVALRVLDGAGDVTVGPVEIGVTAQSFHAPDAAIAAVPGGVAVAWSEETPPGVQVAILDASGDPTRAPVTLGGGRDEAWRVPLGLSLRHIGGALWISWVELTYGEGLDGGGMAEVRVAVIDDDGVREAAVAAPEVDVYRTKPRLVDHGGVPGLAWSEGAFIYVCAGCISDYDVHFLLLGRDDAGDIVPGSAVTVIPHGSHGISASGLVALGADVLFVIARDFHATTLPALATVTCDDAD